MRSSPGAEITSSTSPVVWYSGGACITLTFATLKSRPAAGFAALERRSLGNEVDAESRRPAVDQFLQERRVVRDADRDRRFAGIGDRLAIAVGRGRSSRREISLRDVLDVDEHHRLLRQIRIGGDKTARAVDARRVMARARNEHDRALRLVRGFAKCRASATSTARPSPLSPAPSNQPSTCALRTIDLVRGAANRRDTVGRFQAAIGLRLQIDARPEPCRPRRPAPRDRGSIPETVRRGRRC